MLSLFHNNNSTGSASYAQSKNKIHIATILVTFVGTLSSHTKPSGPTQGLEGRVVLPSSRKTIPQSDNNYPKTIRAY